MFWCITVYLVYELHLTSAKSIAASNIKDNTGNDVQDEESTTIMFSLDSRFSVPCQGGYIKIRNECRPSFDVSRVM